MAARLDRDVLRKILARLDLAEEARFSCVCKEWRSVVAENPGLSKPFSLLHCKNPEDLIPRLVSAFFGTSWFEAEFVGSCEGWLVCFVFFKGVFLLNIASRACINLPEKTWDTCTGNLLPVTLNYSGTEASPWAPRKIVMSCSPSDPDNCLIVRLNSQRDLAFCRLGDVCWTRFYHQQPTTTGFKDIIFIKDQLVGVDYDDSLVVFDHDLKSNQAVVEFPSEYSITRFYLAKASADDKLLVLLTENGVSKVFEIDPRDWSCTAVESLRDKIFFAAGPCSLVLSAEDHPQFLQNHIYEVFYPVTASDDDGKFSKFNLEKKTLKLGGKSQRKSLPFFTLFRRGGWRGFVNGKPI